MRSTHAVLPLALLAALLGACRGKAPEAPSNPAPTAVSPRAAAVELTAEDVKQYLHVREFALDRIERELAIVERRSSRAPADVEELSSAERKAAELAGADWKRYTVVRDEIGRLLSTQRQREDARVLGLELRHARNDLASQLAIARDAASRQFLQAQVDRLSAQIDRLEEEREPTEVELRQIELLAAVRVSLATQQGRLEKIQRRVKDALQRARGGPQNDKAAPPPQVN